MTVALITKICKDLRARAKAQACMKSRSCRKCAASAVGILSDNRRGSLPFLPTDRGAITKTEAKPLIRKTILETVSGDLTLERKVLPMAAVPRSSLVLLGKADEGSVTRIANTAVSS